MQHKSIHIKAEHSKVYYNIAQLPRELNEEYEFGSRWDFVVPIRDGQTTQNIMHECLASMCNPYVIEVFSHSTFF